MLIPAYFSAQQRPQDWQSLAQASRQVPTIVIANPNSGPQAALSTDDINAYAAVQAAGGKVIGYVHTDQGRRPLQNVLADVQTWYSAYSKLDGIFVDEMAQTATASNLTYYENLAKVIRNQHPNALIVANPGGVFDQAFLQNNTADIFVRHEDVATTVDASTRPSWMAAASSSRFAQIKIAAANDASEVRFAASQPAVGWVYASNQPAPNPYTKLPSDFAQAVQMLSQIQAQSVQPSASALCFGLGDRLNWQQSGSTYAPTPQLASGMAFPVENRLISIWLDNNWDTSYFNGLQSWMDQGYVPVIVYYFEGDLAQYGKNAWSQVKNTQSAWLTDAARLGSFLSTLRGTALVVVQPEWNIPTLQDNHQFGALMGQVAQTIRAGAMNGSASNALRLRIGTAVGDFGDYTITADPYWSSFDPAMKAMLPALDFTGFQEMRASTRLGTNGQMQTWTAAHEGLSTLGQRTVALAQYLQAHYGKPILIPYVEIASYTPPGDSENWTTLSAQAYANVLSQYTALQQAGVFGMAAMSLFDDLSHNSSGTDYFGMASTTYGLVQSNGQAGLPAIGNSPYTVKPSGIAWQVGTAAGATNNAVCAIP
jgi:hypothetical protein